MQTLKKLALSAVIALTLSGIAVGSIATLQPSESQGCAHSPKPTARSPSFSKPRR